MVLTTDLIDGVETDAKDKVIAEMVYVGIGRDDSTPEGVGNTDLDDELLLYFGDATSQYDVTDEGGNTFRYTWDGTGTDPDFQTNGLAVNDVIEVAGSAFHADNRGRFTVTARTDDYFEVTNASGVAEANIVTAAEDLGKANRKAITLVWTGGTHKLLDEAIWDTTEANGHTLKEWGVFDGPQLNDTLMERETHGALAKTASIYYKVEIEIEFSVNQ